MGLLHCGMMVVTTLQVLTTISIQRVLDIWGRSVIHMPAIRMSRSFIHSGSKRLRTLVILGQLMMGIRTLVMDTSMMRQ